MCGEVAKHLIEGISDGFVPGIFARHQDLADRLLLLDGRMTEALAERRRNVELDPLQARRFCNYADLLLLAGRPRRSRPPVLSPTCEP